jgi:hypothetical protein
MGARSDRITPQMYLSDSDSGNSYLKSIAWGNLTTNLARESFMSWDAVGAIGEILGAVAVFLTLLYLAVQIKQNTLVAKATIREHRTDSSQKIILALKDEAELLVTQESLTESESLKLNLLMRAMFRDAEAFSYQSRMGLLDESEWRAMKETWRDSFSSRRTREYWKLLKPQYSQLLHEDLAEILAVPPTRD